MVKKIKLSELHFSKFKKYIEKWKLKMGLSDWRLYIEFEEIPPMANVSVYVPDRLATIKLSKTWNEPVTEKTLELTAIHELLHVVFSKLSYIGGCRYVEGTEIKDEEERLVVLFENLFSNLI